MKRKNKFLIFGTGKDINKISFGKIDKSFITAGVNRIFKKFIPDYYFVYDLDILGPILPDAVKVVYTHPDKLAEYFRLYKNYKQNFCTYYDADYMPSYVLNGKQYDCGHGSINYLIRMLNNYLYKDDENIFYIAGVPLLEGTGHFYDDNHDTTSVQKALDRFYNDFMRLKNMGYNIVSLMKKSKLNDLFPIENIKMIYGG